MRRDPVGGPVIVGIPNVQQIVIATASKLLSTGRPLETAHLLIMTSQDSSDMLPLPACTMQAAELQRAHFEYLRR